MDSVLDALRQFGVARIARGLDIRPQAVSQWRRVPAERVLDVERITKISRCRLRPDLYPPLMASEEQVEAA